MGGGFPRHLGMIATSGSWRRYWLPVMWRAWERAENPPKNYTDQP